MSEKQNLLHFGEKLYIEINFFIYKFAFVIFKCVSLSLKSVRYNPITDFDFQIKQTIYIIKRYKCF